MFYLKNNTEIKLNTSILSQYFHTTDGHVTYSMEGILRMGVQKLTGVDNGALTHSL